MSYCYLPQNCLWLSRLFVDLANKNERICLTLDCWGVNSNREWIFTTESGKPDNQDCYFKVNNNDQLYNVFISNRKINNVTNSDDIHFEIKDVKSRSKNNNETFSVKTELNNLIENDVSNIGINGRRKRFNRNVSTRRRRSKSARPKFLVRR